MRGYFSDEDDDDFDDDDFEDEDDEDLEEEIELPDPNQLRLFDDEPTNS